MNAGTNENPTLPPAAMAAMTAITASPTDAPRCCFICLTDEDASDPPNSWVDPCPCTLEVHQDCMLSWLTDCERFGRPLNCPICKSAIKMEGAWDPIVPMTDLIAKRFTKISPFMLFTALSLGIQFSMQMYGVIALWAFSGKDAMIRFIIGPTMMTGGRRIAGLALTRERFTKALVLMNVAPALLIGHLFPGWSDEIFLPITSFYGIYQVLYSQQFFTWLPSPQLALTVFPFIRSVYCNLYKKLVLPYEKTLDRQLLGLPAVEPRAEHGNQNQGRRPNGQAQRSMFDFLQTVIDALEEDGEDATQIRQFQAGVWNEERNAEGQGEGDDPAGAPDALAELADAHAPVEAPADSALVGDDAAAPAPNVPRDPAAPAPEAQAPNHEAPQAPARRMSTSPFLSSVSNFIVNALILPGASFAAGEAWVRRCV
ncbi:hypothetical protein PWT90_07834 [Aphanocladium album]|nr:hypothetical protein PWT90_07834 [Aphanocladium album]